MPQSTFDDKSTLVKELIGAVRQQAITRTKVCPDLCCHMASLGHNELMGFVYLMSDNAG